MTTADNYRSYRGLPELAGLCSMRDAFRPGLSVEACVARLKRYHYAFVRLHEILTARITAEPIYELKNAFAHHSYLCAEHVKGLRERVAEMREPPLGLEDVPHPALRVFFDEIIAAPSTEALLAGVYEKAIPALNRALERHPGDTNPLADAPTLRVLRFARVELGDMIVFGQKAVACLVDAGKRNELKDWLSLLDRLLEQAGDLDGTKASDSVPEANGAAPERLYSRQPYSYDPIPRRDERFHDLWNQGVNAEAFIYSDEYPARAKALMMLFKRLREIDVPEMMASIIIQTRDKPWDYYRDMSRQLWDEARHAMLGEVGFVSIGVDWTKARITHNWSYRLNTECTPIERHAVLYFIEQGLMTKTGKRYEWELGRESGLPLIATIQDYDWADEVLHAQLGRQWYIPAIGEWKEALAYGDACWSRILSNWHTVKEEGLTGHDNWWPAVYLQACIHWGIDPDPKVLSYAITYEGARADMKEMATSG